MENGLMDDRVPQNEEAERLEEEEQRSSTDSSPSELRVAPLTYHMLLDRDHSGYIVHAQTYLSEDLTPSSDNSERDLQEDEPYEYDMAYNLLVRLLGGNLRRR